MSGIAVAHDHTEELGIDAPHGHSRGVIRGSVSAQQIFQEWRIACAHFAEPVSRSDLSAVGKFSRLATQWDRDTLNVSSVTSLVLHPAYQQIIGMGKAALPLILRELRTSGGHWFWALHAITGVDPVRSVDRGKYEQMKQAWLTWAAEHRDEY